MEAMHAERTALIALLQTLPEGHSWPGLAAQVAECGSAVAIWEGQHEAPVLFGGTDATDALDKARAELELWAQEGLRVLTVLDEDYPAQLREINQIPPVLFARGEVLQSDRGVSVVGSRKASSGALVFAAQVAERLVDAGISVVAGLAEGADTAAHTAALKAGGRTVAFIGTGIRKYFPAANRALQNRIAMEGLLMSQFWPDAPGRGPHFLMRNAIMSGYGRATVVVEAGETSGTRYQARKAVEHGRPVILTDRVATGTNWGAKLRDRPGVYVASSPEEVMLIVNEVTLPLQDRVGDLLTAH